MVSWSLQREFYLRYASKSPCQLQVTWIAPLNYRQKIHYLLQDPKPKVITKKRYHQHVYRFQARAKGLFQVKEQFKVTVNPINFLDMNWGEIAPESLSPSLKMACRPQPHWQLTEDEIGVILTDDWFHENDLKPWTMKACKKVNELIKYREHLPERLGALKALMLRYGDCDEFTDVLIAMARLRGIPARRITGYSINPQKNEVTPHAWAELFSIAIDDWIPVDVALHVIGIHPPTHVIMKIEETVSEITDYSVSAKRCRNDVKFEWQKESITLVGVGL